MVLQYATGNGPFWIEKVRIMSTDQPRVPLGRVGSLWRRGSTGGEFGETHLNDYPTTNLYDYPTPIYAAQRHTRSITWYVLINLGGIRDLRRLVNYLGNRGRDNHEPN